MQAYRQWIGATAALVKRLAPGHLVTIGSEGAHAALAEDWKGKGWPRDGWTPDMSDFEADHKTPNVDYATCQLWLEPWGWYSQQAHGDAGLPHAIERARQYLAAHVQAAVRLGKPLMIDELGFGRDGGRFATVSNVTRRDQVLRAIFDVVPLWRPGDRLLADSRADFQGLYSVYDRDASTIGLIGEYAARWKGGALADF